MGKARGGAAVGGGAVQARKRRRHLDALACSPTSARLWPAHSDTANTHSQLSDRFPARASPVSRRPVENQLHSLAPPPCLACSPCTMANDPSREAKPEDSATAILRPKKSCVLSSRHCPGSSQRCPVRLDPRADDTVPTPPRALLLVSPPVAALYEPHNLATRLDDMRNACTGPTASWSTRAPPMTTRSRNSTPSPWRPSSSSAATPSSSAARSARTPVRSCLDAAIDGANVLENPSRMN